ncbi:exodeoxyribonuclease V subunit beta [Tepidibacillus sp. HK-1]|uniref:UvrD-helicase domain-containing protein n=1 Tax=Tepidibacillus sp. HK-1 TaxID=1883407 RepID=UPI000853E49D|nr:UvrD-helicase domain-containing protein [Tepidibacillus sp. HK-1]GBF12308.1 ATP-dependent helicase/nuclease subunit A [Tepidibacillus sp. HK-1]
MAFPLTDEQRFAVDTLHLNCIVPAGAGSGKTRVLVERYLKIIEKYADVPNIIEQIVAITFTEKAAKEMKERVRKGMVERRDQAFESGDLDAANLWRNNIQRLERASISTIHSFCAKILREFPVEAKVDPEFQVLEATDSKWILADTIEREFKKFLKEEKEKGISPFYQWVSKAGFSRVLKQLQKVYEQISNTGIDFTQIKGLTEAQFRFSPYQWITGIDQLIEAGDGLYNSDSNYKRFKEYQEQWPNVKQQIVLAQEVGEGLQEAINQMIEITSGQFGKGLVSALRKKANDQAKELNQWLKAIEYHEWEKEYLTGFYPLLQKIDEAFRREKNKRNSLDFDDLQFQAIRLLEENQEVKEKLKKRISYLMIDEFQDNNQVQKRLISLLLKDDKQTIQPGRLFVVGDPKQSIYRFRGADVHVFKKMEQEISAMEGRIAPLQYNFRSHPDIIQFVNFFFEQVMSSDETSPNYYKEAIAKKEKIAEDEVVEFIPIYHDTDDEQSVREKEATYIAKRIEQLVTRGVEPKEITILFRSMSQVKIYEQALLKKNIPYYVVGGRGFYQKQEIYDLLHVLKYLIDPTNKIALAGILRSPMVAITDDTLYHLLTKEIWNKPFSQWRSAINDLAQTEIEKVEHFVHWVSLLKKEVGRTKVSVLLKKILELTHYQTILFALPQGVQAVANVEKLIRQAEHFPGDNPYSVYEFLQRIERLIEESQEETEAAVESETGNTVKLMTIHQSKGLEFPYVFVPDLSRKPVNDDSLIRFNSKMGLSCKVPLLEGEWEEPIRWLYLSKIEKELERDESVRVFYVAATRAEQKLILSGKVEQVKKEIEVSEVLSTNTWSKWIDVVLKYETISLGEAIWHYPLKNGEVGRIKVIHYDDQETLQESDSMHEVEAVKSSKKNTNREIKVLNYTKPLQVLPEDTRYSVSSIKRYQQCPRYYYFTDRLSLFSTLDWLNEEKIDFNEEDVEMVGENTDENNGTNSLKTEQLTPSLKGTIVHQLLEALTHQPDQIGDWQKLLQKNLIKQGIRVENIVDTDWEVFQTEVHQFVDYFQQSPFFRQQPSDSYLTEYDFILSLRNGKIFGTIDRLDIHSDGTFSIIDYKTDKNVDKEIYEPQILTYALAIQKNLGLKPANGYLYFIRHNQIESIVIDEARLLEWEEQLEEIMNKINQSQAQEDFTQNLEHCSRCAFKNLCYKKD